MAGIGGVQRGEAGDAAARFDVILRSRSPEDSVSARSKASIAVAVAGDSRRQVRHSGPVAGGSSPPIRHVPSSQHAMRTAQWQPWRAALAAASGSIAAVAAKARRNAAETRLRRCIERGF